MVQTRNQKGGTSKKRELPPNVPRQVHKKKEKVNKQIQKMANSSGGQNVFGRMDYVRNYKPVDRDLTFGYPEAADRSRTRSDFVPIVTRPNTLSRGDITIRNRNDPIRREYEGIYFLFPGDWGENDKIVNAVAGGGKTEKKERDALYAGGLSTEAVEQVMSNVHQDE